MTANQPFESQGMRLLRQLFLRGKRIFTIEDAREAANFEKIPQNQLAKILSNLSKQKRTLRLRRGIYVSIGLLPDYTNLNPFVISAYLIQPSAISHWSALSYHGLTEQAPLTITASPPHQVLTPSMRSKKSLKKNSKHAWVINNDRYEYIKVQEKHYGWGNEKKWLDEQFQISITNKERTLLDVFIYSKMFGGFGEALGILENSLATIDIDTLVSYAIKYDKKALIKRLGWALEYFGVSAKHYQRLLHIPIHHYCRLDPAKPARGKCDKKWMIQNNLVKEINK